MRNSVWKRGRLRGVAAELAPVIYAWRDIEKLQLPSRLGDIVLFWITLLSMSWAVDSIRCPSKTQKMGREGVGVWCETTERVKHGPWFRWYPDGQIWEQGAYYQDAKHGTWVEYRRDGQLRTEKTYKRGDLNGLWMVFGATAPIEKGTYRKHSRVGLWTFYDDASVLRMTGRYRRGKRHGTWLSYNDDGLLLEQQTYLDGRRDGLQTWFYPSGTLKEQGTYVSGYREGVFEAWHTNGVREQRGAMFADNVREYGTSGTKRDSPTWSVQDDTSMGDLPSRIVHLESGC